MIGGSSKEDRTIHIIGTTGEIEGAWWFQIHCKKNWPKTRAWIQWRSLYTRCDGDASGVNGTHGGGDLRLVADFVELLSGETPSISTTSIEDSIMGHYLVFKADEARENHQVVKIDTTEL